MNINVTILHDISPMLADVLNLYLADRQASAALTKAAKPAKAKVANETAAPVPAPTTPAPSPAAEDHSTSEDTVSAAPIKHLEIADIRPKAIAKGSESPEKDAAVKSLMQKYGGAKLSDIPAERRADFLAEVEAL